MNRQYRFKCEESFDQDRVLNCWLLKYTHEGKLLTADPVDLNFKEHQQGMILPSPTMQLTHEMSKEIILGLTSSGIVPESEAKIHGLYEAQAKHLEDLRSLIFKTAIKNR